MPERVNTKNTATQLALITLMAALALAYTTPRDADIKALLPEVVPQAESFSRLSRDPLIYGAYRSGHPVGYASVGTAAGYGGPLTVLVGIDTKGAILQTAIVNHKETPSYLTILRGRKFFQQFNGKNVDSPLEVGNDIDAVSGATVSSRAIAAAVRQSSHAVGRQQLGLPIPPEKRRLIFGTPELAVTALVLAVIIGLGMQIPKLRYLTMAASVGVLGFWLNQAISISNIASLLLGYFPSPFEKPLWYLLIPGSLLLSVVYCRPVYCYWLCPFGGLQELAAKVGGGKFKCSRQTETYAKRLRLLLAWIALMLAFLWQNPGLGSYEPFATVFGLQGVGAQWFLLPVAVFASMFIYRFWCRYFCPVGVAMEVMAKTGRWLKRGKQLSKSL